MTTEPPLTKCCPPSPNLLDEGIATSLSGVLKAIAHPVRLRLLHHITAAPDTTVCARHLPAALGISQRSVSHHLTKLVDVGLVTREQRGRGAHYRLDPDALNQFNDALRKNEPNQPDSNASEPVTASTEIKWLREAKTPGELLDTIWNLRDSAFDHPKLWKPFTALSFFQEVAEVLDASPEFYDRSGPPPTEVLARVLERILRTPDD